MQQFSFGHLRLLVASHGTGRVAWVLYPFEALGDWIARTARHYRITIVAVTGMDWDNDLTPWPEKGVPAGEPDFEGKAPEFLTMLTGQLLPQIEKHIGIPADVERTLVGVSLSGLFTMWQWMKCDTFHNIISLSGSFWYKGFVDWVKNQPFPPGKGRACFLLGDRECRAQVPEFRSVQKDTEEIVDYLRQNGIDTDYELVPGNHYQYGLERLARSFEVMFGA